jgi:SAM-dependent methyltransferase
MPGRTGPCWRASGVPIDEERKRRAVSFGQVAEDYDRFRPEPPSAAIEWILPGDAKVIAEIGAGTGALTRRLVDRVDAVYAIEPDPRMRAVLEERVPGVHALEGRGEDIPLDDGSVDAVLAASSWHWVNQAEGFVEVARVLRPGGVIGLLWTGPDRSIPWLARVMAGGREVGAEERQAEEAARQRRHRPSVPEGAPFSPPDVRVFRETKLVGASDLVGLAGTYSAAIDLDPEARQHYLAAVEDFVRREVTLVEGKIELPIGCITWRATRL